MQEIKRELRWERKVSAPLLLFYLLHLLGQKGLYPRVEGPRPVRGPRVGSILFLSDALQNQDSCEKNQQKHR